MNLAKQTLYIYMFRSANSVQEDPYPELNESNFIFRFHLKSTVLISYRNIYFNLNKFRKHVLSNSVNN
jgi:hypothetical protein